ncbi:hypothetical protein STENM223S_10848 [Streptomyces tendae]
MNDTAERDDQHDVHRPLGAEGTTVSTAEDQTKLGIVAMRNPAMVAITSAASWTERARPPRPGRVSWRRW